MNETAIGAPPANTAPPAAVPRSRATNAAFAAAVATVIAASAAGAVMRFVAPSPMWLDEALSARIAASDFDGVVQALRHDGHPLLYYLLLGAWTDLLGGSDVWARALSGVCSLVAVTVTWAAARRRFGSAAARFAAALALTSPFMIRYGSEARMYALAALLAATGWWLTEACLDDDRLSPARLAALAATVAAGLYTHYWMIWLAAAGAALLVLQWLRHPEQRSRIMPVLACFAAGGLIFAPWIPILASQAVHTGTPWAKWARPAEVAIESIEALGGGKRFEPMLLGVLLAASAGIGATALRVNRDRSDGNTRNRDLRVNRDRSDSANGTASPKTLLLGGPGRNPGGPLAALSLGTLSVGGLAAMATGGAYEARYAAVVMPMLLALAGRGLAALPPRAAWLSLAALAVFGVVVAADDARRDRSQGQQVAQAIEEAGQVGDAIVMCPDQLGPAVLRYLDLTSEVLTFPPTDDPARVDWYNYHDRIAGAEPAETAAAADEIAGSASVWLVMAPGYHGFGQRCEALSTELGRVRASQRVVTGRPVYEPMFLFQYQAPAPS